VWWWSELSTVTTTAALGDTRSLLIAPTVSAATSPGICTTIPLTDLVGLTAVTVLCTRSGSGNTAASTVAVRVVCLSATK
jgi:hypothetical protein